MMRGLCPAPIPKDHDRNVHPTKKRLQSAMAAEVSFSFIYECLKCLY